MNDLNSGIFGLLSALTWGAGDFSGGYASKRGNIYAVVIISQVFGMLLLILLALLLREETPLPNGLAWGAVAGLLGSVGIIALYRGLSSGRMGVVAPVSAVVAAAIPVVVGGLTEGTPASSQLLGFGMALVAVWLISRPEVGNLDVRTLVLPVVAGIGFGTFFVVLNHANDVSNVVIWNLVAARCASLAMLTTITLVMKQPLKPERSQLLPIVLAGILDAVGNAFFAFASLGGGRLDVASVLSSLYPASTVLLAWLLLREKITGQQVVGLILSLLAIVFITAPVNG